jgi:hypothetical protein
MPKPKKKAPIVMVSSTVYGIEELLERIYVQLTGYGYEVWCSHMGSMPVNSALTAFDNCKAAVRSCDLFFGLITPQYGSGKDGDEISIVHQEVLEAIKLNKPRWFLAHDHVVFARTFLEKLSIGDLVLGSSAGRDKLVLKKSAIMDDLRIIDVYEVATRAYKPGTRIKIEMKDRVGNWVQKYISSEDAMRFAMAQFHRFQEVEEFLKEQFDQPGQVMARAAQGIRGQEIGGSRA